MDNLFEKATREKIRFNTPQGLLHIEDVWELPLSSRSKNKANLNDIAKMLHKELKDDDEMDFVTRRVKPNEGLVMRFEIVKHIIDVRLAEKDAAENLAKAKEKKAQIMSIMAEKETESLKGKSFEELKALLDSL